VRRISLKAREWNLCFILMNEFIAERIQSPHLRARDWMQLMIKEYAQRIYSAAVVFLWVVVVSASAAIILASTIGGGISWL
jgi:hypothetical protein